ncbi:MAG: DNA polymerase I [Hymenobacteraceae bacterium]|nr:DNA polymerase I [Hymenobacteraceae bacterium]
MRKLFLLDALALIYRAHFAMSKNPRLNSRGLDTGAILGFTNTLLEVLQKEQPTHIGVCFDTAKKTFRHDQFEAYKANRQAMPEALSLAIPYVKRVVAGFGIPVLLVDGYEADDLIGTLVRRAEEHGFEEVYMMTPDKDYCQLVTERVKVWRPAFMGNAPEVLDIAKVLAKFEIERVEQVIDILGLQGDAVDNIPGIPGIGEKTARTLIRQFGSVEGLIANVDQLKGKQQENVRNFAQQGLMSKELATIHCDVPLPFEPESLQYTGPQEAVLRELFEELEFRQLAQRILGGGEAAGARAVANKLKASLPAPLLKERGSKATGQLDIFDTPAPADSTETAADTDADATESIPTSPNPHIPTSPLKRTLRDVPHRYHLLESAADRALLIDHLRQQPEFSFDTETTSVDALTATLVGMSFCWLPGEAYYVPVPPQDRAATLAIVAEFREVLENPATVIVGQNLKYDLLVMRHHGVTLRGKLWDTMLAHYLLEPEQRHGMDALAEQYLDYSPVPITDLIGPKGKGQKTMADLAPAQISDYAAEDADITLQLKRVFEPLLLERDQLGLLLDLEGPLVPVLAAMEEEGIRVDVGALAEVSAQLAIEIQELEGQIYALAGQEFNLGSPKQIGEVLFDKLKLGGDKTRKTRTGQHATGEEILSELAADGHEIAQLLLDHRQLSKLKSTYVDALPLLIRPSDGRVHTTFNQAIAATGRLSSTNPNLQNIPIRTDRGREIRRAFVPRDADHLLLAADYSQIELRLMADFSADETMRAAFANHLDIHQSTASKIFHVPLESVTGEQRRRAKTANFGIIYGISAFGLAQRLKIPRKDAAALIDAYFTEFPAVKRFMDQAINDARDQEYAITLLKRRRYLRDINSRNTTIRSFAERNAINAPLQGTAADIIKRAMIDVHAWLESAPELKTRMILQVHDELVFDVPMAEVAIVSEKIAELMVNALPLPGGTPMEVEIGLGDNWLKAH